VCCPSSGRWVSEPACEATYKQFFPVLIHFIHLNSDANVQKDFWNIVTGTILGFFSVVIS
jgi:hypothetical protein